MNYISFPGLGIELKLKNYIDVFGFRIYWYAIIISMGLILAFIYALRNRERFGIKEDDLYDGIIFGVPSAIIGARLFYVIFDITGGNLSNYSNFWDVINIRNGGLAIYGAVIAVVIMIFIFCRIKKIKPGALLDITSIGFSLGQGIGRWGNFINGEVYGVKTDLPWRMEVNGMIGHPLFLYESIWDIAGFFLLHFFSKSNKKKFEGEVFLSYMAWYGLGRGILEGMRTDEYVLKLGPIPISQLLGFTFAIASVAAIVFIRNRIKTKEIEAAEGYSPVFGYIKDDEENTEVSLETEAENLNPDVIESDSNIIDVESVTNEEDEKINSVSEETLENTNFESVVSKEDNDTDINI